MEPLEFMQRLVALVPRSRLHLTRFHGVLAPNAKLRSKVVPGAQEKKTPEAQTPAEDHPCAHGARLRCPLSPNVEGASMRHKIIV